MSNFDAFLSSLSDEQKAQLMQALMPSESKETTQIKATTTKPPKVVGEDFMVTKADSTNNRRKEPVRGRENRWRDEGEFRDIETPEFQKTPRRREASKKLDLECHVCGKSFKEDARFVYGEFPRCNRCTGK
jgi:hypothetical protein